MIDLKQLVHKYAAVEIRRARIDGIFIGLIVGSTSTALIIIVIFLLTR